LRAGASPNAALAKVKAEPGLDAECVEALARVASPEASATGAAPPAGLSAREIDVLRLVASGLTVKEAAAKLFVSPHTARHHLEHAYEKIGVTSRAGAVLFAIEHGLVK
jgi:DNA-binding CsgD family transcriptional regulator